MNQSEDKFRVNLKINNLLDQDIYLKETTSMSLLRIESSKSSSSSQVEIEMEKFNLNRLAICEDSNELVRMINEKLNIQFALCDDDQSTENLFHVKLGLCSDINKYVSKLFKCPIELDAQVFDLKPAKLETLLLLASLRAYELTQEQTQFRILLKLRNKKHILMFPNTSVWYMSQEDLKSESNRRWCKQWSLIQNPGTPTDLFSDAEKTIRIGVHMQFKSNQTAYIDMAHWNYKFNLVKNFDSNSCSYIPNY